ncbi:MAG: Fe-S protein assembly co-chaperone HscB [Nitrospirales bacterium]
MEQAQKPATIRTELPMARSLCWHCESEVTGEYFCERCVKVQPLSKDLDYFTCLGLPRMLNIDLASLEGAFYKLSRSFHPDFYQAKDPEEQQISLGNSALLNTAYRTLKDPVQRAEYLIRLEAGAVKEGKTAPPADLFEEILSLQEDLEEYRSLAPGDTTERATQLRRKLRADRDSLKARQQEMEQRLFGLFTNWDDRQRQAEGKPDANQTMEKQAVLKEMQEILSHRTYVRNIVTDLTETIGEAAG